jgi:hypothetical protein
MPRWDEKFKDCSVLANHFRIKTTLDYHIATVDLKTTSFPTYVYGAIRSTDDSKVKKIANSGTKVVGVASSRFKGNFYLFSFDLASGGNHQKLSFVESLMAGEQIASHMYCSDPSIDLSFQMGSKKGLLFIVAPPPGELSDGFESGRKEIIVKADMKELGLKSAKLKLRNLFDDEEADPLRVTSKDLKDGIALDIEFPDGKIFLVEGY